MRTAILAFAISTRSMDAITRDKKEKEGETPIAAVFDMIGSHLARKQTAAVHHLGLIYVYQMPSTSDLFAWQHENFAVQYRAICFSYQVCHCRTKTGALGGRLSFER